MRPRSLALLALCVALCGCRSVYDRERQAGLSAIGRAAEAEQPTARDAALAEAEAHFRAALAERETAEAQLDLARCLLAADKPEADDAFSRFVALDGERPRAYLDAARAQLIVGRPATAADWIDRGLGRHPGHAELLIARGDLALVAGDEARALRCYRALLASETRAVPPSALWLRVAKAELQRAMRKVDAELARARGAEGQPPDWQQLSARLAQLADSGALGIEAVEVALRRALLADPSGLEARLLLGSIYQRTHRLPLAQVEFEEALRLHPDDRGARLALASTCHALGQLDAAAEHYRAVLAGAPELRDARLGLGLIDLEQGRTAAGLDALLACGADELPEAGLTRLLAGWPADGPGLRGLRTLQAPADSPRARLAARLLAARAKTP